jgi:hypothetical protein
MESFNVPYDATSNITKLDEETCAIYSPTTGSLMIVCLVAKKVCHTYTDTLVNIGNFVRKCGNVSLYQTGLFNHSTKKYLGFKMNTTYYNDSGEKTSGSVRYDLDLHQNYVSSAVSTKFGFVYNIPEFKLCYEYLWKPGMLAVNSFCVLYEKICMVLVNSTGGANGGRIVNISDDKTIYAYDFKFIKVLNEKIIMTFNEFDKTMKITPIKDFTQQIKSPAVIVSDPNNQNKINDKKKLKMIVDKLNEFDAKKEILMAELVVLISC